MEAATQATMELARQALMNKIEEIKGNLDDFSLVLEVYKGKPLDFEDTRTKLAGLLIESGLKVIALKAEGVAHG